VRRGLVDARVEFRLLLPGRYALSHQWGPWKLRMVHTEWWLSRAGEPGVWSGTFVHCVRVILANMPHASPRVSGE
jgi:hypothetical protein